jgi:hypothetical protein
MADGRLGARVLLALALALGGLGCGGEEARPSGRSMSGPAEPRAAARPEAANAPPRVLAVRLEPSHPVPGDTVHAEVRAEDPDGDAIRLRFTWLLDGVRANQPGDSFPLIGVHRGTRLDVVVVATDGRAESEPGRASVEVENRPPRVTALSLLPEGSVPRGRELAAVVEIEDADGDDVAVRYTWLVNGRPVAHEGPSFATAALARGDRVELRVVARDEDDAGEPATSAPVAIENLPPEILSAPGGLGPDGVFRYAVEARDPDGDRSLRYALAEAPAGMTIDDVVGLVTWTPGAADVGTHAVEIAVVDPFGAERRQRFELSVRREGDPAAGAEAPAAPPEPGEAAAAPPPGDALAAPDPAAEPPPPAAPAPR